MLALLAGGFAWWLLLNREPWYVPIVSGVILGAVLVSGWTSACVYRVAKRNKEAIPGWMVWVAGLPSKASWFSTPWDDLFAKPLTVVLAALLIGLAVADDLGIAFPIVLLAVFIPGIILVERHFRQRTIQKDGYPR